MKLPCPTCGLEMHLTSIPRHRRNQHGEMLPKHQHTLTLSADQRRERLAQRIAQTQDRAARRRLQKVLIKVSWERIRAYRAR